MEIFLRRISTEDAEEACVLSNQLGYPLSPEQMRKNIEALLHSADSDGFVAVHDDRMVGWIGVRLVFQLESPPYAEISGLIVDHSQRKRGIGNLLVQRARSWAREKGYNKLRVRCNTRRSETLEFYEHLQFKGVKDQRVFEIDA